MAALGSATVNVEVVVDPWSLLTMRVWAANLEAAAELDAAVEKWADWVAALPTSDPFDWLAPWWRPALTAMRNWPNPAIPWPAPQLQAMPTHLEVAPYRPGGLVKPPNGYLAFDGPTDGVDAVPAADVRSRGRGWRSGLLNWSALRIFPRPPQLPRH